MERAPLHHTNHCGDFIVVADADLGMGIVGGAEGAQKGDVLLKLGQGRAAGKGPQVLTCILVLGSHRFHLHGIALACERGPADRRARCRALPVCRIMHPAAAHGQGRKAQQRT